MREINDHKVNPANDTLTITLHAPQPKPAAIDGSKEAFERDHPDADKSAADLFADALDEAPPY